MAVKKTASTGKAGQWQKGQSGNPLGRRKQPDWLKEKLDNITPDMIDVIESIARDVKGKGSDRLQAAEYLVDRRFGRPTQPIAGDEEFAPILLVEIGLGNEVGDGGDSTD